MREFPPILFRDRPLAPSFALLLCLAGVAAAQPQPQPDPQPQPEAAPQRPPLGASLPPAPSGLRGTSLSRPGGGPLVQAPLNRLVLNNLLVIRLNPVGLEDQIRFGLQRRIIHRGPAAEATRPDGSPAFTNLLLRDAFVFLGIAPRLNPAFIKIGPSIEIQPVSIFNLRVAAEYIGFFSTFGFLQSYASPLDDYNDQRISACSRPDALGDCRFTDAAGIEQVPTERRNYKTGGAHVMIEPLIQLKFGPIALRNKLAFEYWYMNTRDGDTVFYDVTLDTLVPRNGWVLANDLDLLYVSRFGLTAGVRYSAVRPLYTAADLRPGEDPSLLDNDHQRIGPMIAYTFFDRGFTGFNKPTLLLIANWYVDHRYRTGQQPSAILGGAAPSALVQSAGMPYIVLGFAFQSDLLRSR